MVIWLNFIKLHDNPPFCPVWLQIESLKEAWQTLHPSKILSHAFHSHISKRYQRSKEMTK